MVKNALFGDKHLIRPAISWESGGIGGQVAWGNLWVNFGGPMGSPYKWPKINWVLLVLFHPYEWNYTPTILTGEKGPHLIVRLFFFGRSKDIQKQRVFVDNFGETIRDFSPATTIHPYFFGLFQPQNCGGWSKFGTNCGAGGGGLPREQWKGLNCWLILHYGL